MKLHMMRQRRGFDFLLKLIAGLALLAILGIIAYFQYLNGDAQLDKGVDAVSDGINLFGE